MMIVEKADLWFQEGSSDKVYHAAIEESCGGFIVTFQYGRRGGHMNTGTKTDFPVSRAEAQKVFDKLVQSKLKKGYQPS